MTRQTSETLTEIDATGLQCPMPVIKMEAALRRKSPGQQVLIRADDPLAVVDIPHFCRKSGHCVARRPDEGAPERPVCVFLVTAGPNPG